jgi:hypothetical protein
MTKSEWTELISLKSFLADALSAMTATPAQRGQAIDRMLMATELLDDLLRDAYRGKSA